MTCRFRVTVLLAGSLCALIPVLVSCARQSDDPLHHLSGLAAQPQPVVYGNDDRTDYFAHPDEELRRLTRASTVALIERSQVAINGDEATVIGPSLGRALRLCDDQRFFDDPSAAECSATLIDDDLILTAGHCIFTASDCQRFRYVFNYRHQAPGTLATISAEDVFTCRSVPVQRLTISGDSLDFAIVQLDRPATPRFTPTPVQATGAAIPLGEPVSMIGFPSGIPAKIDAGGRVTRNREARLDFFEATVDAFGGNSGSGVYDGDYRLIGVLARGQTDYVRRAGANCYEVSRLQDRIGQGGSEGISYAARAIETLCEEGWNSPRLCGEAVCGDGICGRDQTATSCPEDCVFPTDPPDGWTCEPGRYADGESCNCNCGLWDPDCTNPDLPVTGCEQGEACAPDATCGPAPAVPPAWTCPAARYGNGICDCACGAPDPDCTLDSTPTNCPAGSTCSSDGICVSPATTAPADWTCAPDDYDSGRACNCDCGAQDPDCQNPALPVVGCDAGQICSTAGLCVNGAPWDDSPGDTGDCDECAAASPGTGALWVIVLGVLVGLRRRARAA